MKTIIFTLALILATNLFAKNVLVLKKKNTIALRGVVTWRSIKTVQETALKMSTKLSKKATIYLVLDTPGGGIEPGLELINTLTSLPQKVKPIALFAASMGFVIFQNLNERLVSKTGTLMSHRAYITLAGQLPGEFNSRSRFFTRRIAKLEKGVASRLKMSLTKYRRLIKNEFWIDGEDAVKINVADRVSKFTCSKDLMGSYTETLNTFLGKVYIDWSSCPLITTPLEVSFNWYENTLETKNLEKLILLSLYNKKAVINNPVLLREYIEYVK